MKQILAVVLLLLSLASAAWADGGGFEPPSQTGTVKPPAVSVVG